jgi:glycosyltransferase involved in cell wall biosynthesis
LAHRLAELDDVLVVTVRKSFWASQEAERFPRRLYARVFYGHSTSFLNSLVVFVRALIAIVRLRPRVVLLGSVERTVPWFVRARRAGLLRGARLVVTNQLHLSPAQLALVDRNIVYSSAWRDAREQDVRDRAVFFPLPADGDFGAVTDRIRDGGYVFAGGGTGRDFTTAIEALRETALRLRIVTFSPETLGFAGDVPANVEVEWTLPLESFLERVAGARIVIVPLRDASSDFGQTTVVQALSLGKPVVATRSPGVVDYVREGIDGLLVEPGDVEGLRAAVLRLDGDDELRRICGRNALERAREMSYAAFAERVAALCKTLN